MSIDTEPATRVERDLRDEAVAPIAAACGQTVAWIEGAEVAVGALVTCFDVLDRAERIAPIVESLLAAARDHDATVVVSVPNDALGGVGGPSSWGEGSVAELRSLLPEGHTVAGIFELRGAAVVPQGSGEPGAVELRGAPEGAPAGWLLAFGPHAGKLASLAAAGPLDRSEQRRWERSRESELEFLRAAMRRPEEDAGPPKQLPAPA